MRTSSGLGRGLVLVAVVALGAGCSSGGGGGGTCSVSGVAVSANPTTVNTGQSSTLTATVTSTGCSGGVSWSATPAGGTLTPSGTTATFVSNTTGSYTVTATSSDDVTKSGSATVTVGAAVACGSPNGVVVTHTANITASETWAGGGVTHSVPNNISINGPATVTVQPCALVALGQAASITVNAGAKLLTTGTSDTNFVAFIRADNSKAWGILRGTTATSFIELHWTAVQGGGDFSGQAGNPAIAVAGPGYGQPAVGVLKIDNVLIDTPLAKGVYMDSSAGFTTDSQNLVVQNAPDYVLEMTMMAVGTIPPGSDFSTGNAKPVVNVIGPNANVTANLTIHKRLPVRIQTGSMTIVGSGNSPPPVTLTLEAGVQLLFPKASASTPGARVYFGGVGNAPNNAVGTLVAQGTATDPVIFTSGEASPAAGDWTGLILLTATGSQLDNVFIEYAGAFNGIVSANCKPTNSSDNAALVVGDDRATTATESQYVPPGNLITNSVIQHSAGHAINAIWQTSAGSDTPVLTNGNTISDYVGCAQTYNYMVGGMNAGCPLGHGCTTP
jgi:hypothetical protein